MANENQESSHVSSQAPTQAGSDAASVEQTSTFAAMEVANEKRPDPNTETEDKAPILAEKSGPPSKDFSDWNSWEKQLIIFTASSAALFSPLSANIYFPIFNILAKDLHVTNTLINLTVTTYMVSLPLLAEAGRVD